MSKKLTITVDDEVYAGLHRLAERLMADPLSCTPFSNSQLSSGTAAGTFRAIRNFVSEFEVVIRSSSKNKAQQTDCRLLRV